MKKGMLGRNLGSYFEGIENLLKFKKSDSRSYFERTGNLLKSKRSQITVFVIIALLIVAGIAGFFIFKNSLTSTVPTNLLPAYNYYISCVEQTAKTGASIMGSQAGYLENPIFKAGSSYSPFSSELGFMGLAVPYWYYISGNGVAKNQIPDKKLMQLQLASYIKDEIKNCDIAGLENQGFSISLGDAFVKTTISDNEILVSLNQKISISRGEESVILNSHEIKASSMLGALYDSAKQIYNYEQKSEFLENYSVDVLYTYAPVTGAILNCSPAIWDPYSIIDHLKLALEANIGSIKFDGDYYSTPKTPYFIAGKDSNINLKNLQVSFLYSREWPSRFEVWPTKNNLMMAEPIGNQQGLGVLGFCYIPYKFVYDLYFPVLVQLYDPASGDIFQFPFSIVIDKNVARKALATTNFETPENICDNANTDIEINTLGVDLSAVEADVKFKCFENVCNLGRTKINNQTGLATLSAKVPQCINGIIGVSNQGYKTKEQLMSTNEEFSADLVLEKEYKLNLEVYVDNILTNDFAIVSLTQVNDNITTDAQNIAYPSTKQIILGQGEYSFDLKVYSTGKNFIVPGSVTKQCVQTPKSGLFGLFGMQDEKCFDINIPTQTVTNLISAGGVQKTYIVPSELENAKIFKIYAKSIPAPNSIEDLQIGYDKAESQGLNFEII
jgi:hypothetical protein